MADMPRIGHGGISVAERAPSFEDKLLRATS